MTTFYLRHNHFGFLHPFPFSTSEGAERFRRQLGAENDYTIYEKVEREENEDEREARLDRKFENEVVEQYLESGHETIQL
jgi:hypothetical protein